MSFKNIDSFLSNENLKFVCKGAGSNVPENSEFVASVFHETTPGLDETDVTNLRDVLGEQEQLFSLLRRYSSIRLYCDSLSDNSAYYIAHPSEWAELSSEFSSWIEDVADEELDLPEWLGRSIVFAEIPSSANYFLLIIKGDDQGKVYVFDHDGFEFEELACDIDNFVQTICIVNDSLLEDISSHTRYSDGQTDIQWMPVRVVE